MTSENGVVQPIIICNITDSKSIKGALSLIKPIVSEGNLIFTKNYIKFIRSNVSNDTLIEMYLNTDDLITYQMNAYDDSGDEITAIEIGIKTVDIMKIVKLTVKKDSLNLYMMPDDTNLYIQIFGNVSKSSNQNPINIIPTNSIDYIQYSTIEYKNTLPNVKISSLDFSKTCSAYVTLKCKYVIAIGYPKGIIFKGILPSGEIGRIDPFGECSNDVIRVNDDISNLLKNINQESNIIVANVKQPKLKIVKLEDTMTVKIGMVAIKALSKINNLAECSILKIFIEPNKPLKILSPIGNFGHFTMYIRDVVNL